MPSCGEQQQDPKSSETAPDFGDFYDASKLVRGICTTQTQNAGNCISKSLPRSLNDADRLRRVAGSKEAKVGHSKSDQSKPPQGRKERT
jgi:hypothetical protein